MFDGAGITGTLKNRLWGEAMHMAVDWWNVSVKRGEEMSPEMMWSETLPRWIRDIKCFGDVGVVKRGGVLGKLEQKGFDGIKVGNTLNSAAGVHRMYNLSTGRINVARDINWINKTYGEYKKGYKRGEDESSAES